MYEDLIGEGFADASYIGLNLFSLLSLPLPILVYSASTLEASA